MNLPRLLVIADVATAGDRLVPIVDAAVTHGARGVVLRGRDLPAAAFHALAARVRPLLQRADGLLILAGSDLGDEFAHPSAQGVHLCARGRFPQPRPAVVGRSCHTAAEVDAARAEGCDYVFASPCYPTASKPGYGPALGPTGLAALCRPGLATYALGGVLAPLVPECLAAGAYGVAVMGPIMRDPHLVGDYLKELPL